IFWYLLITGFALESFLSWFFNVYIITDERVIDVDFLSLIYKNISSAKIDNIEDITAETGGAVRSIFNFGTVKIQTAGAATELEFEDVPHPAKVTRLLNELLLEEEREKIEGRVR
ncbi:MAG TPA: PH domain-containing protein, partial [Patescibacteria group bacterium]